MNYDLIKPGMVIVGPPPPGGWTGHGMPVRVLRYDPDWDGQGAWQCETPDGQRTQVWRGIARLYTVGVMKNWYLARSEARKTVLRKTVTS